jgi:diketogulonate reductase-like aldo/keto reductase
MDGATHMYASDTQHPLPGASGSASPRAALGPQAGGVAPRITRLLVQLQSAAQAVGMNKTSFMRDKPVNRIGFGAMQLAGPGVFGPPRDPDGARAVLRRAVELGVDHIDTAQYYGPDVVNDLIRETLRPYPENLKLVTKVGGRRDDQGAWLPAQSPAELRAGVEDNLRSLMVERMDLVNLRLMNADAPATSWPNSSARWRTCALKASFT